MAVKEKWNKEELELLTRAKRNNEIVEGMVRSVGYLKMPVEEDGRMVTKEVEVAKVNLPGGVLAYCPVHEFSDREFKSLAGFVGTIQHVVIDRLDLENQIAIVSVKQADHIMANEFWDRLEHLEKQGTLNDEVFEGTISGFNSQTNNIYVRVSGVDAFMSRQDWDHGYVPELSTIIERGAKVEFKVKRFDKENKLVQVSRKDAIPDPFDYLKSVQHDLGIAGKVTAVHPIHGIFVRLDNNLEVKASKPRSFPEPLVDEIVRVRVQSIDEKKRRAKVVITGYPQGKKSPKDVAGFLFD